MDDMYGDLLREVKTIIALEHMHTAMVLFCFNYSMLKIQAGFIAKTEST